MGAARRAEGVVRVYRVRGWYKVDAQAGSSPCPTLQLRRRRQRHSWSCGSLWWAGPGGGRAEGQFRRGKWRARACGDDLGPRCVPAASITRAAPHDVRGQRAWCRSARTTGACAHACVCVCVCARGVGDALWSGLTAGQTLVESVPGQDSNLPSSDTDDFEVLVVLRSDYFAEMF